MVRESQVAHPWVALSCLLFYAEKLWRTGNLPGLKNVTQHVTSTSVLLLFVILFVRANLAAEAIVLDLKMHA